MKRFPVILAALALAAALSATSGTASAAPRLYCGWNLDRVCRLLCPKCAAQSATAPRNTSAGR